MGREVSLAFKKQPIHAYMYTVIFIYIVIDCLLSRKRNIVMFLLIKLT